jgi:pimeloyl-ACP methyl ester carboxylesterase
MRGASSGDGIDRADPNDATISEERSPAIEEHYVTCGTVRLHTVSAGPVDGPVVILLHGYPEFWYGWHNQIPALAGAGYRVVVPDQRGYNLSDKPADIRAYAIDLLVDDVVNLITKTGRERVALVGHDWGGMVAWWVAERHPALLDRLIVSNIPHPAVMREHLRRNPRQLLRSWYAGFFQIPWLPEKLLRLGHWAPLVSALRQSSSPGAFSPHDIERYRAAWSQPGAMTAMINWYRAALRSDRDMTSTDKRSGIHKRSDIRKHSGIDTPTLLIWGARDRFLGKEMARPSVDRCRHGELALIPEATHWVHHDQPELFNSLISRFLLH